MGPIGWTLVFSFFLGGGLCPAFNKFELHFPTNENRQRGSYMPKWHSASALIRHVANEYWVGPESAPAARKEAETQQHTVAKVDRLP